jgi:hypothetical protein
MAISPTFGLALPADLPLVADETAWNRLGVRGEVWMGNGDSKASKGEWLKRISQEGDIRNA